MATQTEKMFESLAESLPEYRRMETSCERHVFLLWLLTRGVTMLGGERPILVGGGAVEFYTGVRFATGDLDLVAPDRDKCEEILEHLGFERPEGARHHVNRSVQALVEIHSEELFDDEEGIEVVYRKVPLLMVSPEDCIVERLTSYCKHSSTLDLLNAFLIMYHQRERLDVDRLAERISDEQLWDYYRPIQDIGRSLVCKQVGVDEVAAELIRFMKEGAKECGF